MASRYAAVRLEGFSEFSRALKKAGGDFTQKMKDTNYKVGGFVVDEAKGRAGTTGGVAGKAADSLRATKTAGYAAVRLGGSTYPYALGAEFGSKKYGQFPQWRGGLGNLFSGGWGYFLGPSIRENEGEITALWFKGVDELLDEPFNG